MRILVAIILVSSIFGCSTGSDMPIGMNASFVGGTYEATQKNYNHFKVGKTTSDEVYKLLGKPSLNYQLDDRKAQIRIWNELFSTTTDNLPKDMAHIWRYVRRDMTLLSRKKTIIGLIFNTHGVLVKKKLIQE